MNSLPQEQGLESFSSHANGLQEKIEISYFYVSVRNQASNEILIFIKMRIVSRKCSTVDGRKQLDANEP